MTDETASSRPPDITTAVTTLSGILLGHGSFAEVLQRAAAVVKQTVDGADEVSVTMQNGRPTTVASSGRLATEVDESQYEAGYGPCLDAIRLGQTMLVEDLAQERRWPAYSPRAVAAGVLSSLSVPLPVDGKHVGAFNIYSLRPHAFDTDAVSTAENLAGYAAIVLNNAGLYFSASERADQLAEAMRSRAVIEQAKGILMGTRHCAADEAFALLVELSQRSQRKLNVVAQALVDSTVSAGGPR